MLIESAPLWLAMTNCYVVAPERGGPAAVVDAPPDAAGIASLLKELDCYPAALLVTHGHVDHVGAAGTVAERHGSTVYVHPDDDFLSLDPEAQLRALFGTAQVEGDFSHVGERVELEHGAVIDVAGISFTTLHTPGHTPGHCCFHVEEAGILFSGDQLFAGSIGRTDLPGGDFDTLMRSMRDRVLTLPDETEVLPGHGPRTTLAVERRTNPFLRPFA